MKRFVIAALVCVNVVLLAMLALQAVPQAQGQDDVYFRRTNYILVTGQIQSGYDAVYVIDVGAQRLGAWRFDLSTKRLVAFRGRMLNNDFRSDD
jgi:hypothetical protein